MTSASRVLALDIGGTKAMAALGSLFLANDRPAIRKTLLRLRYLDKFAEEARARRMNIERSRA